MPSSTAFLAQVLVLAVANYLLVLYLTDTTVEGPFRLFDFVRHLAGIRTVSVYNDVTGETDEELYVSDRFWAKILDCYRCSSPYGAFLLVLLSWLTGFTAVSATALILWLAVTGATVLIFETLNR